MPEEILGTKEAIKYLGIEKKEFDNYFRLGQEIKGEKIGARFKFKKSDLDIWKKLKEDRIIILNISEYERCFEFAIKRAYSSKGSHGTGIRGARSEVQMADDHILGILAELGVKKFLSEKFKVNVELDLEVHADHITEQDFTGINENRKIRPVKIGVAVKSSKWKNCFNIIDPLEYDSPNRKSDVYIFVRVGLPSDHLFRILREHSFFKNVKEFLDKEITFRKINELKEIPVWIAGFSYHGEFDKVKEIPNQKFDDWRYVKEVGKMHNSDKDWEKFVKML